MKRNSRNLRRKHLVSNSQKAKAEKSLKAEDKAGSETPKEEEKSKAEN